MSHDLHSQPPVVIHGMVAGIGSGGGQGVGDSIDDGGGVGGATVAVVLHAGNLLIKVLLAIVLAHHLRQLVPHLVSDGLDALGAVEAGGSDEVAGFHHADFHTQGVHLVAQAVRESLHSELGDAVRGAGCVGHAAQHAADVDNAAYRGRQQAATQEALPRGAEDLGPGMLPEAWLEPGLLAPDPCRVGAQPSEPTTQGQEAFSFVVKAGSGPHNSIGTPVFPG